MSTTWAATYTHGVKATCTSGSENAPSAATDGLALSYDGVGLGGFSVFVKSTASAFTAGTLKAYLFNPQSGTAGEWYPAPDLNLTVGAATSAGFAGFRVPSPYGRIAYVPDGLGQANLVYINGTL